MQHYQEKHMNEVTRPINEENEKAIREAFATLQATLASVMGASAPHKDQYSLVGSKVTEFLTGCDKYRRETALNSLRGQVLVIAKDAVSAKRNERDAFNAELAKIENPAFRAIVAKSMPATDHVVIPLASFVGIFPSGTDTATMRVALQAIGMKLTGPTDNMGVRLTVA
jgi:hypothetical protein